MLLIKSRTESLVDWLIDVVQWLVEHPAMMVIMMTWQLVAEVEAPLVVRVGLVHRDLQDNLEPMEILETMVRLEIQEHLDKMLSEMSLQPLQIFVLIVQLAHLDHQVVQDQRDLTESQAPLEIQEVTLCRDHQDRQDHKGHRELMDCQVTPELLEYQAKLLKCPEHLDQLGLQDHQGQ